MPDLDNNRVWLGTLGMIGCLGLLANIVLFDLDGFKRLNFSEGTLTTENIASPARPLEVARSLKELGIEPGDQVGVIGYAYDSFWARLARVTIVAEMLEEDASELWQEDGATRQKVLNAYAGAGADAVVAAYAPPDARLDDWHQIGDSSFYIYILKRTGSSLAIREPLHRDFPGSIHAMKFEHRPILEDVSIVIRTLGREILEQCLYWILAGSAWPGCLIVVEQGTNPNVEKWLTF